MIHSILVFLLLALCSGDVLNSKITKENTLNAKKKPQKNPRLQQKSLHKMAGYPSLTPQLGTQALGDSNVLLLALCIPKNDCESDMNIDFGVTRKFQQAETLTNMECVNNELDCYI